MFTYAQPQWDPMIILFASKIIYSLLEHCFYVRLFTTRKLERIWFHFQSNKTEKKKKLLHRDIPLRERGPPIVSVGGLFLLFSFSQHFGGIEFCFYVILDPFKNKVC